MHAACLQSFSASTVTFLIERYNNGGKKVSQLPCGTFLLLLNKNIKAPLKKGDLDISSKIQVKSFETNPSSN
jgi:hypothetical protein